MTRLDEVLGARRGVDGHLDRVRPVGGGDSSGDTVASLDRDRERRPELGLVLVGHLPQTELLAALRREAQADQAPAVHRHEVDRVRRHELRRDREVALVLAVDVVGDDDEPSFPDLLDRLLDRGERARLGLRGRAHSAHRSPAHRRFSSLSTYFARTSTSRFTGVPGRSAPSVVASSVWGTSAIENVSPSSPATVSDTPSTVIEPFSTQYRRTLSAAPIVSRAPSPSSSSEATVPRSST